MRLNWDIRQRGGWLRFWGSEPPRDLLWISCARHLYPRNSSEADRKVGSLNHEKAALQANRRYRRFEGLRCFKVQFQFLGVPNMHHCQSQRLKSNNRCCWEFPTGKMINYWNFTGFGWQVDTLVIAGALASGTSQLARTLRRNICPCCCRRSHMEVSSVMRDPLVTMGFNTKRSKRI